MVRRKEEVDRINKMIPQIIKLTKENNFIKILSCNNKKKEKKKVETMKFLGFSYFLVGVTTKKDLNISE